MKQKIRLTESDLHRIVKESVNRVLNEISYQKAQAAYQASQDMNRPESPAMQRRMSNNPLARTQQMDSLKQGASNSFNRDYGYNLKNVPYGSGDDDNMGVADPSKPYYGGGNLYGIRGDYFASTAGKGVDAEGEGINTQMNTRPTRYWGNNPNEYNERNINISTKDKIMNPRWASAVNRGEKALNNTIKRTE